MFFIKRKQEENNMKFALIQYFSFYLLIHYEKYFSFDNFFSANGNNSDIYQSITFALG